MHSVQHLQCNVRQRANADGRFDYSESELNQFVQEQTLAAIDQVFIDLETQWGDQLGLANISISDITLTLEPVSRDSAELFQQQIYQQLHREIQRHLPASSIQEQSVTEALVQLQRSLDTQQSRAFVQHWIWLTLLLSRTGSRYQNAARTALLQSLQRSLTRIFLARTCDHQQLYQLIELLEPAHVRFIMAVLEQSELFAESVSVAAKTESIAQPAPVTPVPLIPVPSVDGSQQQLVEFTLAFISAQRGSKFNRKSYLRSVLHDIAAHYNSSVSALSHRLHELAEQVVMPSALRQELLDITEPEALVVSYQEQPDSHRILLGYEKALQALRARKTLADDDWVKLLLHYPAIDDSFLDVFLAEVLTDKSLLTVLVAQLSGDHRRIVLAWLSERSVVDQTVDFFAHVDSKISLYAAAKNWMQEQPLMSQRVLSPVDSQAALQYWLANHPEKLRTCLLAEADVADMLQAMVSVLTPSQLLQLTRLLSPTVAGELERYGSVLRQRAYRILTINPVDAQRAWWLTSLTLAHQAAQKSSLAFSLAGLLTELVQQIRWQSAQAFALTDANLLMIFSQGVSSSNTIEHTVAQTAVTLLRAQNQPLLQLDQATRLWLSQLEQALLFDRPIRQLPAFINISEALRAHMAPLLRQALRSAAVRERFIKLPVLMQPLLLQCLLPDDNEMILSLWQQDLSSTVQRSTALSTSKTKQIAAQQLKHNVQLFCLSYLAYDRGSQFNQHSFGYSLIQQISAHFNISHDEFRHQLHQGLAGTELEKQFDWLWQDQAEHSSITEQKTDSETVVTKNRSYWQGEHCSHILRCLLAGQFTATTVQWRKLIQQLQDQYPQQRLAWFRHLQLNVQSLQKFQQSHEGDTVLLELLGFVFSVTGHVNSQDGYQLLTAVKKFAAKSHYPGSYYYLVIDALLRGQWLDLEAILAQVNKNVALATVDSGNASDATDAPSGTDVPDITDAVTDDMLQSVERHLTRAQAMQQLACIRNSSVELERFMQWPPAHRWYLLATADPERFHLYSPIIQALLNALQVILGAAERAELERMFFQVLPDSRAIGLGQWSPESLVRQVLSRSARLTGDLNLSRLLQQLAEDQALLNTATRQADTVSGAVQLWKILSNLSDSDFQESQPNHQASDHAVDSVIPITKAEAEKALKRLLSHKPESATPSRRSAQAIDSSLLPKNRGEPMGAPAIFEKQIATRLIQPASNLKAQIQDKDTQPDTETQHSGQSWLAIANAGVVIVSPYIPMLFERLSLIENNRFIDEAAEQHAASVLNYLCLGDDDTFITGLGAMINLFINRAAHETVTIQALTEGDKKLCDGLLQAVIGHWNALGNTSLAGLRETFLQRQGAARFDEEKGWFVKIEKRPFDVLLKRLPWGISTVKHQFMNDCINVEW
jgi:hypothetical protein